MTKEEILALADVEGEYNNLLAAQDVAGAIDAAMSQEKQ